MNGWLMWRGHGANQFVVTLLVAVTLKARRVGVTSEGEQEARDPPELHLQDRAIYIFNLYCFYWLNMRRWWSKSVSWTVQCSGRGTSPPVNRSSVTPSSLILTFLLPLRFDWFSSWTELQEHDGATTRTLRLETSCAWTSFMRCQRFRTKCETFYEFGWQVWEFLFRILTVKAKSVFLNCDIKFHICFSFRILALK